MSWEDTPMLDAPNSPIERFRAQRADQLAFVDELLSKAEADGRDLVDAELKNLEAARTRVKELDAQIEPIEAHMALRAAHTAAAGLALPPRGQAGLQPIDRAVQPTWNTPGQYVVDHLRANGYMTDPRTGQRLPADPDAQARVRYALANQTTADTPGLLPHLIVGSVVNLIDASRPFITSIGGGRPMGGIPGKTFGRPKVTQHTLVGVQATEKTELPTRKMIIGEVPFTKVTKGGAVDVSRQDIDWSSPAAWDILVRDLADSYAIDTENEAADAFAAGAAGVNTVSPVGAQTLAALSAALYTAAGKVYASARRLPDRIWMSTDMWGLIGPAMDTACCAGNAPGSSSLTDFGGNLFQVPRIIVPSFPAATLIIGSSAAFEVYEEAIGLLTAVEPSLLGVEVAYGGYIAFNYVFAEGVAQVTGVTAPPGTLSADSANQGRKGS
jgi:hypothetical protein